jgi:hypothetical protein
MKALRSFLHPWASRLSAVTVAMIFLGGAGGARANLITNGDFTNGSSAGWTAFQTYNPGASDSVEVNPSGVYGLSCYDANCYNMEVNANTLDTVTQTVSGLTVGATYTLSWAYSGRTDYGNQELEVSFGGGLLATELSSVSAPWTTETFTVTATQASEVLSFASENVGGSPGGGNEVTAVSLTQAVAEPEAVWTMLTALAGLAFIRRRTNGERLWS